MSTGASSSQLLRWVLTLNNYDLELDFKHYLTNPSFKLRRAVIGKEVGSNGVRHLQGYIEFVRSVRLNHCKKIFSGAYWAGARESSLVNFNYCTKSLDYFVIGDFTKEESGSQQDGAKISLPVPLLLQGLLNCRTASQVKVSKEYFERHSCFDKVTSMMKALIKNEQLFRAWETKKLYLWQHKCLEIVLRQSDRQITWIVDTDGNCGKSYLAHYLSILYGFQLVDGTISTRDAAYFVSDDPKGFCFDVSRSASKQFDYSTLECMKNGFIMTGKYAGKCKRFPIVPVVVFANFYPNYEALSRDRWQVLTLGSPPLTNLSFETRVCPRDIFPFVPPLPVPNLSENFDLRDYLQKNLPKQVINAVTPSSDAFHTSQVAGPSSETDDAQPLPNHIDGSLPSQSQTAHLRIPVAVRHIRPGNCNHHTIDSASKGCQCIRKTRIRAGGKKRQSGTEGDSVEIQQGDGVEIQQGDGVEIQQGDGVEIQQGDGVEIQQGDGVEIQQGDGVEIQQGDGVEIQQGDGVEIQQGDGVEIQQGDGVEIQQGDGVEIQQGDGVEIQQGDGVEIQQGDVVLEVTEDDDEADLRRLLANPQLSELLLGSVDLQDMSSAPLLDSSQNIEEVISLVGGTDAPNPYPLKRNLRESKLSSSRIKKAKRTVTFEDDSSDFISDSSLTGFTLLERCLRRDQNKKT